MQKEGESLRKFMYCLQLAEGMLTKSELVLMSKAQRELEKLQSGGLSFIEVSDLWEQAIDSVPGARDAIGKKWRKATELYEAGKVKDSVLQ